jgi:type I site-specific restriction endonuclease
MMVKDGLLSKSVPEIVNSNLFKFSPFKAVTLEQAAALNGIIERIVGDFTTAGESQLIVQGDPGTGKTIVAIYLMKLLRDIARASEDELLEDDSIFSEFFTPELSKLFGSLKIALVVPQQALRKTLEVVFSQTPGLNKDMVLTQFEVAESKEDFDLLIVDEAHRLGQRANQNSAGLNKKFTNINIALFGHDDKTKTQLDWIEAKRHRGYPMAFCFCHAGSWLVSQAGHYLGET